MREIRKAVLVVALALPIAGSCETSAAHGSSAGSPIVAKVKWPWKTKTWKKIFKKKRENASAEPQWNERGIYPSADDASSHALELQRLNLESKVAPNLFGSWTVLSRQAWNNRQWIEGGIYSNPADASTHALELQRLGFKSKVVPNIVGGWTALYQHARQ